MESDLFNNISNEDFDSDDSDMDPNFNLSACSEESSSSANNDENSISAANEVVTKKCSKKEAKDARNKGQSYTTSSGKVVPARVVRKLEACRKKCAHRITFQEQEHIHKQYWEFGSYNLCKAFISGLIEVEETKTVKRAIHNIKPRIRAYTNNYFLEVDGNKIAVCQRCFLYTLSETEQFIKTIVNAKLDGRLEGDRRGKHVSARKLPIAKENEILDFIKSFPSYESHYTRRDTSKRYLPSDLSVAEMHRLYGEKYACFVSLSKFSQLFSTLNLKFKKPKIDTCHKCDLLQCKIQVAEAKELDSIQLEQSEHLNSAEEAYDAKKNDKQKAITDATLKVLCFDLQQCLPTPLLRTSLSFYKRPLWTFNLTVHDCATNQGSCYMWHEAIAKRGGNEIASCVFAHLLALNENVKHMYIVQRLLSRAEQKFIHCNDVCNFYAI